MALKHMVRGSGEFAILTNGPIELCLKAEPCNLSAGGLAISVTGVPPGTPVERNNGWCIIDLPDGPVAFAASKSRDVTLTKPYCLIDAPPAWRVVWNVRAPQVQGA